MQGSKNGEKLWTTKRRQRLTDNGIYGYGYGFKLGLYRSPTSLYL